MLRHVGTFETCSHTVHSVHDFLLVGFAMRGVHVYHYLVGRPNVLICIVLAVVVSLLRQKTADVLNEIESQQTQGHQSEQYRQHNDHQRMTFVEKGV